MKHLTQQAVFLYSFHATAFCEGTSYIKCFRSLVHTTIVSKPDLSKNDGSHQSTKIFALKKVLNLFESAFLRQKMKGKAQNKQAEMCGCFRTGVWQDTVMQLNSRMTNPSDDSDL